MTLSQYHRITEVTDVLFEISRFLPIGERVGFCTALAISLEPRRIQPEILEFMDQLFVMCYAPRYRDIVDNNGYHTVKFTAYAEESTYHIEIIVYPEIVFPLRDLAIFRRTFIAHSFIFR